MELNLTRKETKKTLLKKELSQLKVLSLFSGCGGMDLGFEGGFEVLKKSVNEKIHPNWIETATDKNWVRLRNTKFKTVFANDIRPGAKKVWENFWKGRTDNFDNQHYQLESIVDLVKKHWDGESVFPNGIDVVTGGFPCQDFSVAGKRKGFESHKNHLGEYIEDATEETRGKLYMWMREVIDIVKPKVFIAENVKGLVSLGDVKKIIQKDFENIGDNGYIVLEGRVLHAGEYGVPQSRERVFFMGFKKSALTKNALKALSQDEIPAEFSPFPTKTHSLSKDKMNNELLPHVSLGDAFIGLKEPEKSDDTDQKSYSKAKWYGKHCQGNKEISLDKIGPTIRSEHHGNIEFRRLSPEHGGAYTSEFKKGFQERRLTVRECARIQTFPDSLKFVQKEKGGVSESEAYKLIGNAVPPLLAYNLATRLEEIWEKTFK